MAEFFAKIIRSQPKDDGIATSKTVTLVPKMFLKIPEIAEANAAPIAMNATIHENSLLDTKNSLSSLFKSFGAAGLDHPRRMPNMNAPP